SAAAAETILCHRWDENLRGLHRLALEMRSTTSPVSRSALPAWLSEPAAAPARAPTTPSAAPAEHVGPRPPRPRPSREELVQALVDHDWSIRATARHFERDRKQISRWIEYYVITVPGRG